MSLDYYPNQSDDHDHHLIKCQLCLDQRRVRTASGEGLPGVNYSQSLWLVMIVMIIMKIILTPVQAEEAQQQVG